MKTMKKESIAFLAMPHFVLFDYWVWYDFQSVALDVFPAFFGLGFAI